VPRAWQPGSLQDSLHSVDRGMKGVEGGERDEALQSLWTPWKLKYQLLQGCCCGRDEASVWRWLSPSLTLPRTHRTRASLCHLFTCLETGMLCSLNWLGSRAGCVLGRREAPRVLSSPHPHRRRRIPRDLCASLRPRCAHGKS
jgi:hypothetical protein